MDKGPRKIIPNEPRLQEILAKLRQDGADSLQLVLGIPQESIVIMIKTLNTLDFDGTITGIGALTSWGVIESYNFSEVDLNS
jgi:hypothetical protein